MIFLCFCFFFVEKRKDLRLNFCFTTKNKETIIREIIVGGLTGRECIGRIVCAASVCFFFLKKIGGCCCSVIYTHKIIVVFLVFMVEGLPYARGSIAVTKY